MNCRSRGEFTLYDKTREQFSRAAQAYTNSALFALGQDLAWLTEAAAPQAHEAALDVGTAAGHTAFALAPHVSRVVGLDITPAMIEAARQNAAGRGVGNFEGVVANAEDLPFPDGSFDIVACRYTAHHFLRPDRVLAEFARVLRPGGRLVVVDNTSPEEPELDEFINLIDSTRDPSHVRQWSAREWETLCTSQGLTFEVIRTWLLPLEFHDWTARQQTPPDRVAALRTLFQNASQAARQAFAIQGDSFALLTRLMRAVKL